MGKKRSREDAQNGDSHPPKAQKKHHSTTSSETIGSKRSILDSKHPSTSSYARIPHYDSSKRVSFPASPSSLPSLPSISSEMAEVTFTHASVADKYTAQGAFSYDRLEFVGDAYLEVIATRVIFSRFPQLHVGKMSVLREKLVRNSTLASFARRYKFPERLRMDKRTREELERQESRPDRTKDKNTPTWEKILGDLFESYVAAIVLSDDENGFEVAENWLTSLWLDILLDVDQDRTLEIVENRKDELARKIGGKEVKIEYMEEKPAEYTKDRSLQQHHMAIYMTGWGYERKRVGGGTGTGKKEAGMRAAADALDNNAEFIEAIAKQKQLFDAERRARIEREKAAAESAADVSS